MKSLSENPEDLLVSRQKKILADLLKKVKKSNPDLYYSATIEVAYFIHEYIHQHNAVNKEEFGLIQELTPRDIQLLLSEHVV